MSPTQCVANGVSTSARPAVRQCCVPQLALGSAQINGQGHPQKAILPGPTGELCASAFVDNGRAVSIAPMEPGAVFSTAVRPRTSTACRPLAPLSHSALPSQSSYRPLQRSFYHGGYFAQTASRPSPHNFHFFTQLFGVPGHRYQNQD